VRIAAAYGAAGSMATNLMASRKPGLRCDSQSTTVVLVRPGCCPSKPCCPDRSTNPVSQGSTRRQRPVARQRIQRGLPRRVSSMPSTRTGAGSPSRPSAWAMKARCAVGHDTPWLAATSATERAASPIAAPIWVRNLVVVRALAGTWAIASVNDPREQ